MAYFPYRLGTVATATTAPWTGKDYALNDTPDQWAIHDGSANTNKLCLKTFGFSIPDSYVNRDPVGFKVKLHLDFGTTVADRSSGGPPAYIAPTFPPGNRLRFNVALTKDGVNPAGTVYTIDLELDLTNTSGQSGYWEHGSPTDLWGTTWTEAEVEAANFGLLIWNPNLSGELAGFPRGVDWGQISIFTPLETVNLHLVGSGDSSGNVSLDWDD